MEVLERDRELAVLEACLGRARRGRGQLVWVRGEAGIGKTTLVDRFTERLRGARLVRGTCDPLVTPRAFGPLLDIYDRLGLGDGGDVEPTRDAVFRRLRDELLSEAWVTVAVIEDVHWADEATFDLLRFLGRRVVADAARVVADRASSWEPAARQKGVSIVAASAATVLPFKSSKAPWNRCLMP
jgi:predicted ATPase